MEYLGTKMADIPANEYPKISLHDLFMKNNKDLKILNDMCEWWDNHSISIFSDDRFGGIDEEAAKKIVRISINEVEYNELEIQAIPCHFLRFNDNIPVYPNLRLPNDILFQSNTEILRVFVETVRHTDINGNLYFGLSLWKGNRHILVHLGSLLEEAVQPRADQNALSIAASILQTNPENGSFVLNEMSIDILENCIREINEKNPNCQVEYTEYLEERLEDVKGIDNE